MVLFHVECYARAFRGTRGKAFWGVFHGFGFGN
jgi:hypothetical protein